MEVARERGFFFSFFLFFFFLSGEWERACCFLMDVLSVRRKN